MAQNSMAQTFVQLYAAWAGDPKVVSDLNDWLKDNGHIGDGEGQVFFIQHWSVVPNPDALSRYSIMDFSDGSIAIKRGHEDGPFLIAKP